MELLSRLEKNIEKEFYKNHVFFSKTSLTRRKTIILISLMMHLLLLVVLMEGRERERERERAREREREQERERARESERESERERERERERESERESERARESEREREKRSWRWPSLRFPYRIEKVPGSSRIISDIYRWYNHINMSCFNFRLIPFFFLFKCIQFRGVLF